MQIEIVKVGKPYKEGRFGKLDVEYIRDGKNVSRKLAAVGETEKVVKILADATPGDHYEIQIEKKGDFYNWNDAKKVEAVAAAAKTSYQAKTNTYETPEERARKQVYIVRQSSITNAIEVLKTHGEKVDAEEVKALAQEFVDFVFDSKNDPYEQATFENSEDDKPWEKE